MSVPRRILSVEEIGDSIAESPDSLPLTHSQKQELDKRLDSYNENPDVGTPWEEVKAKLLSDKETLEALENSRKRKNLTTYANSDELFEDLGI